MNYLVPVGSNLGHSQFFTWLDKNHPEGSQVCWNSLELMCWEAWTHPDIREIENPPTEDEILDKFNLIDRDLIQKYLGYDSFIDLDLNDVFLIVPEEDLRDFEWRAYEFDLPTTFS